MLNIAGPGISRRRLLCVCTNGVLLTACGGGGGDIESRPNPLATRGCLSVSAKASQASAGAGCNLAVPSSGNQSQDAAFLTEFNAQGNFWAIPGVSFAFLNDCNSPNALANPNDKSILFGIGMAADLLNKFGSNIPLWQVMAHEWGHQVQFALGDNWLNAATVAPKELEADMFSGFYIQNTKQGQVTQSDINASLNAAFMLGDWNFNERNHHGTPNQRVAAVLAGSRVADEAARGLIPRTYPSIRQRFLQELTRIL